MEGERRTWTWDFRLIETMRGKGMAIVSKERILLILVSPHGFTENFVPSGHEAAFVFEVAPAGGGGGAGGVGAIVYAHKVAARRTRGRPHEGLEREYSDGLAKGRHVEVDHIAERKVEERAVTSEQTGVADERQEGSYARQTGPHDCRHGRTAAIFLITFETRRVQPIKVAAMPSARLTKLLKLLHLLQTSRLTRGTTCSIFAARFRRDSLLRL